MRKSVINELDFMDQVAKLAKLRGWIVNHDRPAMVASGEYRTAKQFDGKGFPDLLLLRPDTGHRLVAELKVGTNTKTPEQEAWLSAMERCGIPAFTWYPADWDTEIVQVLEHGAQPRLPAIVCSLLEIIRVLSTSPAVTDTIWMPGYGAVHTSASDVLSWIASEFGATDEEIEKVIAGEPSNPDPQELTNSRFDVGV